MSVVSYNPQSMLMWQLFQENTPLKTSTMTNRKGVVGVHAITGKYDTTSVVSAIVSNSPFSDIYTNFLNLENHKLSSLVPEIRLYKLGAAGIQPFYFPEHAVDPTQDITGTGWSTYGTGIKSFDVKFTGTDPFTAKRYLDCNLSIYVDNLSNIFRSPPSPNYATLADLFTISTKYKNKTAQDGSFHGADTFTNPNFEIVATLGYAAPPSGIFNSSEISDIRNNVMNLRMTINDHTINVNQDGTAIIDVSYTARLGPILNSGVYNLFSTPQDIANVFLDNSAQTQAQLAAKIFDDKTSKADAKAAGEDAKLKKDLQKTKRARAIMDSLFSTERIYTYTPSSDSRTKFLESMKEGEEKKGEEKEKEPSTPPPKEPDAKGKKKKKVKTSEVEKIIQVPSAKPIRYCTFGDLISHYFRVLKENLDSTRANLEAAKKATSGAKKSKIEAKLKVLILYLEKFKKIRVLLADVRINDRRYNLADLPISTDLYKSALSQELVASPSVLFTPKKFLSIAIKNLIPGALKAPYDISIKMYELTGPELRKKFKKSSKIPVTEIEGPIGRSSVNSIKDGEVYYVITQSADRKKKHGAPRGDGSLPSDTARGVYHLRIGQNRGLVKAITFQKFDTPFKREALMTNSVSLYDELKMPYSANVEMYGNNLFLPGSQLFIDPHSMGFGNINEPDSPSNRLGLGGYYTVLAVTTTFDGTNLNTSLECSFGSFIPDKKKNPSAAFVQAHRHAIAQASKDAQEDWEEDNAPKEQPNPVVTDTNASLEQNNSPSEGIDGARSVVSQMRGAGIQETDIAIVNKIERNLRANSKKSPEKIDSDAHQGRDTTVTWSHDRATGERGYRVRHNDGSVYVIRVKKDGTSSIIKRD